MPSSLAASLSTAAPSSRPAAPGSARDPLLAAAARIARRLCDDAVWDVERRRCSWIGRRDVVEPGPGGPPTCAGAVGPELYAGSAGIALFLAEAHRLRPDPRFAETAAAAVRRSARYLEHDPRDASPLTLHAGHVGVAYAAVRVLDAVPGCGLEGTLGELAGRVLGEREMPPHPDVIGGHAGAIPALLWLSRRPGLERCLDAADRLGRDLCRLARWDGDACRWEADEATPGRGVPLTGFSHGASGIALALLELHARTGEPGYLRAARGGFAFEDTLFSAADGNWADTRFPVAPREGGLRATFQEAWCHGAPGIALARARAAALDPGREEEHRGMAMVAAETTAAALRRRLAAPGRDATLCHGAAGLSEALLTVGMLMGVEGWRAAAREAALALVREHGQAGDWPSGVNAGGPNPSLMIGTAGVGHHLLRVAAPGRVDPVLLVPT